MGLSVHDLDIHQLVLQRSNSSRWDQHFYRVFQKEIISGTPDRKGLIKIISTRYFLVIKKINKYLVDMILINKKNLSGRASEFFAGSAIAIVAVL
jgi:hypothetical protein